MILPALYHWSPADRHDSIRTTGLIPGSAPTVMQGGTPRTPYICLGFTPSGAWSISGAMDWVNEVEEWDLWQARIDDGDSICIRPDFGPILQEVKVYSIIPVDRIWHVGKRLV